MKFSVFTVLTEATNVSHADGISRHRLTPYDVRTLQYKYDYTILSGFQSQYTVASPEFCVRGHRFGFVKTPKIINVYTGPFQAALYTTEYALLHYACVSFTYNNTRSSADADNRLDAFSGQSRSTNMVPFHM